MARSCLYRTLNPAPRLASPPSPPRPGPRRAGATEGPANGGGPRHWGAHPALDMGGVIGSAARLTWGPHSCLEYPGESRVWHAEGRGFAAGHGTPNRSGAWNPNLTQGLGHRAQSLRRGPQRSRAVLTTGVTCMETIHPGWSSGNHLGRPLAGDLLKLHWASEQLHEIPSSLKDQCPSRGLE